MLFSEKHARLFPKTCASFQGITYVFFKKPNKAKTTNHKIDNKLYNPSFPY